MNNYDPNVAEVQSYLRALLQEESDLPPAVIPDGIFGPETADAVSYYPRSGGLDPTGEVDYQTWDGIIRKYGVRASCSGPSKTIVGFRSDELDLTPPGNKSISAWFAQVMLRSISRKFEQFTDVIPNGINDGPTSDAFRYIQEKTKTLYHDGTLDRSTWNAIVNLYNLTL